MVVAALLLSMSAYADAIGPPPEDCPSGSTGRSSHAGRWCKPLPCVNDTCEADGTCETTGLCLLEASDCGGGRRPDTAPCTRTRREAVGLCRTDADCTEGTCVVDAYCVASAEREPAPEDPGAPGAPEVPASSGSSGCLCSSGTGASMVFLFGLLPLTRARRRQR